MGPKEPLTRRIPALIVVVFFIEKSFLKTVEDFTNDNKSKKEFYQLANELLERMNINEKIIEQSYNWYKCKRI